MSRRIDIKERLILTFDATSQRMLTHYEFNARD
jgi:hypothetical protein